MINPNPEILCIGTPIALIVWVVWFMQANRQTLKIKRKNEEKPKWDYDARKENEARYVSGWTTRWENYKSELTDLEREYIYHDLSTEKIEEADEQADNLLDLLNSDEDADTYKGMK